MVGKLNVFTALLALASTTFARDFQSAIERRVKKNTIAPGSLLKRDDTDPALLYPAYNLSVPIDHFHNDTLYEPHSNGTFNLRYWFDATYYKPGGPVIVLQSGETSGVGRLGFLQKGLLHDMAVATHGVGVVLEHRYYGTSMPTPDLSTKNLRFLTTDQALADEAYFAKNVVFKGLEHHNLTAPNTAYIGYGGSYAGAFVAILRKQYPDVFWGTISSSGVVEAIWDYWAYFEPIRTYADQACISIQEKGINMIDNIIFSGNNATISELKKAFGLPNVTYDNDFANTASYAMDFWQGRNWDPALNDPGFDEYCANLTSPKLLFPANEPLTSTIQDLLTKGGYGSETSTLTTPLLNWIGWMDANLISSCESSQDSCFGTHNATYYAQDDISQDWRSWPYQYCTQWGYLQTGSGVPKDQLSIWTRTSDLAYLSIVCNDAFGIYTPPNVTAINKYGGFNISYPRLAFVDGQADPWRPATVHASPFNTTVHNRTSTIDEPFLIIDGAVHHWDENGLFANETVNTPPNFLPPIPVRVAQSEELAFVRAWMLEWKLHKLGQRGVELRSEH